MNSNTVVFDTWKTNKMRLIRIAEKESRTILHEALQKALKKHAEDNKAHRKRKHSEGDGYSLKRGKWRAGTLVNALKMAKIGSNLHTGQYPGGASPSSN